MARDARKRTSSNFPQLPPAPDDYPTFPDTSTWPVVFPELPAAPYGGPCRPPQHTSKAAAPRIPADRLPNHVAIVMDGNGRWATQRGLARTEGHKMGEAVVIDIACGAIELGIKWLSLYAFSTENWKRSPEEVRFLMGFNRDVVRRRRDTLKKLGVRIRWVGSRPRLWRSVINELAVAEEMTKSNDVITINYCVNYGGRTEITEATREIAREVAAAGSTRSGSPNPRSPATCSDPTFPTLTSSCGPRVSSAPATSCCGRRPTLNTYSRTSSGPTMTAATCGRPARNTRRALGGSGAPSAIPTGPAGIDTARCPSCRGGTRRRADGSP